MLENNMIQVLIPNQPKSPNITIIIFAGFCKQIQIEQTIKLLKLPKIQGWTFWIRVL